MPKISKIIKIKPFKGKSITDAQIRYREARVQKAYKLMIQNSSLWSSEQRASQMEQISNACAPLADCKLLNDKQYARQLKKYFGAINKIGNRDIEETNRCIGIA